MSPTRCYVPWLLAVALAGCSRDRAAPSPTAAPAPSVTNRIAAQRLPENPVAARQALEQWQEHAREEERMRQANYDRRRLPQHRLVLAELQRARESYDRADTAPALSAARSRFRAAAPALRRRIHEIDRWASSSKLLPSYATLIDLLSNAYPQSKVESLKGDSAALDHARKQVNSLLGEVSSWLKYAEAAEEE